MPDDGTLHSHNLENHKYNTEYFVTKLLYEARGSVVG
jgi:hypothetical protein